jgi:outer membrane protein
MKKLSLALLAGTLLQATPMPSHASDKPIFDFADKERWIFRARAINVDPDEDSKVTGLVADVTADDATVPEIDFTYFFSDHIGAELILATAKHEMGTNTNLDLGDVMILPPTVNLQYHFNPKGNFRPYAGAGLGYIFYYDEEAGSSINTIEYDDGISYSLQVGMDYGIDEHWAINADVKKLYHQTDVTINGGAITADVDLDPWIFGLGVAYRF